MVVVVLGVGGGCVLAALAGARRTQTTMRRFVAYNEPEDVSVFFDPTPGLPDRVAALPEVARTTRTPYLMMSTDPSRLGEISVFGATDDNALRTIERPMLLDGRIPEVDRADEVVISDVAARQTHLRSGSSVTLYAFSRQQIDAVTNGGFVGTERPAGDRFVVRVVGVVRQPADIAVVPVHQDSVYDSTGSLYTTPAFVRQYASRLGMPIAALPGNEILKVRLRRGAADLQRFVNDVNRIAHGHAQINPSSDARITASAVQRAVDVETFALFTFAVLAAVATLVLVSLSFARMMSSDAEDYGTLRTFGMTRGQLVAVAMARPVGIAALGGIAAIAIAIAVSPLTPIGIARQAELHPGVSLNVVVVFGGFAALMAILIACAFALARRATRPRSTSRALAATSVRTRRLVLGPRARLGLGLTGPRESVAGRRVAAAAIAVATAAVVAAATFVTSLGHLVSSPAQQGWTFDVVVGNANDQNDQVARDTPMLDRNHYVAGYAAVASPPETPTIDGHNINVVGVEQRKGTMEPPILQGRFANASDEIVLGRASLRAIHKHVGDTVVVTAGQRTMTMRIVGVALGLSAGSVFNGRLDEGAIATLDALKRIEPDAFVTLFFVRFAPGVDHHAALASLRHDFGRDTLLHVPAQDVENLVRVDTLPRLLAVLLVAIALATLANTLFATVKRQRRSIATLKAIGFERSQVAGTVFSQTWALTIVGVAIGLPVGVVIGSSIWRYIASRIGSVEPAAIPTAVIVLGVVAAALSTTLVAMFPAVRAARLRPAAVLRDE